MEAAPRHKPPAPAEERPLKQAPDCQRKYWGFAAGYSAHIGITHPLNFLLSIDKMAINRAMRLSFKGK